jgi:predicted nucleic acid-binding protein
MRKIIISDTSCIIQLDLIGELEILKKLFGHITVTPEIESEFIGTLPDWFSIKVPQNKMYQKILEISLDKGEASAIALAVEADDALVVIDDLKGRKLAEQLGIKIIGTLGIVVDAKLNGHLASVKNCIDDFKRTGFRINAEVEEIILRKAGEI